MFSMELRNIFNKLINYEKKTMLPLTDNEKILHDNQKVCFLCKKEFCTDKNSKEFKKMQKVRDHCHYTGKYRGAAHSVCNLNIKHQTLYQLYFIMPLHMIIIL